MSQYDICIQSGYYYISLHIKAVGVLLFFLYTVQLPLLDFPLLYLLCHLVCVAPQHHRSSDGAQLGVWRERQAHTGAQKNPRAHRESSGWSERTVWAPLPLTTSYYNTLSVGDLCFGSCVSVYLYTWSSDESRLRQQQQALELSRAEVRQAVAGREEAEQIQAQLEESKVNLEKLGAELLSQQEHSECGEAAATFSCRTVFLDSTYQGKADWALLLYFRNALHQCLSHTFTPGLSALLGSFTGPAGDIVTCSRAPWL